MPRSLIMEECFLDYCCLNCDRETAGEAYCSQRCRLADLDASAAGSEPSSPAQSLSNMAVNPAAHSHAHAHADAYSQSQPATARSPSVTGFHLPPAFDFAAYRRPSPASAASSRPTSWFSTSAVLPEDMAPSLSPSSSRHSLKADAISHQARTELRSYTNSFDQVRDFRRRLPSRY